METEPSQKQHNSSVYFARNFEITVSVTVHGMHRMACEAPITEMDLQGKGIILAIVEAGALSKTHPREQLNTLNAADRLRRSFSSDG
ncbi:hypothetical protein CDAR_188131 [Caerostris darwini]|uniref:Uncharacterized protein n=1 Tax=Caerostris darwini TaxID=1538125 RepID=A0AAV4NX75_9ARAC|nr:hypothetical protein CDAR_188131 [Caerostris darwini]